MVVTMRRRADGRATVRSDPPVVVAEAVTVLTAA